MGGQLGSIIPYLERNYATTESAYRAYSTRFGGTVGPNNFAQAMGEWKGMLAMHAVEPTQDLRFKPLASEAVPQYVVKASAKDYAHEVTVFGETRSGEFVARRMEVPVDEPVERWRAIRLGEEQAQKHIGEENPKESDLVKVYGGVHIGLLARHHTTAEPEE